MGTGKVRQWVVSIICNLSALVAGVAYCWFEPLTLRLVEDPDLDLSRGDVSWLVAILMVGAGLSPLVAGHLTNRVGRKLVIMSIGPLCMAGWTIVLFSKTMLSLTVVRILHGLASGVATTIAPIYTAEIAEPKLRGRLTGTYMLACCLGMLYAFCIGPYLSYDMYAYACLPLPIIFTFIWLFVPETPYYLLMSKREDDAKKVLMYFRDGDVENELKSMREAVAEEMSMEGSWKTLFSDKVERKAFIIVQIVSIAKNLTGIVVIENYALETFSRSKTSLSPEVLTILLGSLFTLISVIVSFMSDWVGRKPLLLLSCFGCFVCHLVNGGYYYIEEKTTIDASGYIWALYVGLFMYCVFSDIGVDPILQTLQSEMFGASTRGVAGGITVALSSFLSLILIKLYTPVNELYGMYLNFWLYSLVGLVCCILLYCLSYETAGKIIGQMGDKANKKSIV